ncbi:MAG TPA: hypothetical protein VIE43_22855 [Thermoanaerobaculia bacterium]|jgi:hypothetical protein|nr:hypothetical protein [Thermoanaerobaculia bacterium]
MKTLLRAATAAAVLALSVLAAGRAAITPPPAGTSGTCRSSCYSTSAPPLITYVNWSTTQATCCSGSGAPCPAGTHEGGASGFQPKGGFMSLCIVS